jgi:energy-coupling factor transporter ATP-binding protein EcfA2
MAVGSDVVVHLQGVAFRYPDSDRDALHDVDLTIRRGEIVGIVGASGAGKSTLALVISGQIPAFVEGHFRGDVMVLGRSTRGRKASELAESVGIVYQDPEAQLYGLTVEEELAVGLENRNVPAAEIEERIRWALDVVGLRAALLTRSPYDLSGGEKQRVVIASVLALRPAVLVLDEPTSALDPGGKSTLYDLLGRLAHGGVTVIVVEHDLERLVLQANRLIWLEDGTIRAIGSPAEVLGESYLGAATRLRLPQVTELARRLGGPRPYPLDIAAAIRYAPIVRLASR